VLSTTDAERCRSWFAWGVSGITSYLSQGASTAAGARNQSSSLSAAAAAAAGAVATTGRGANEEVAGELLSDADVDELLALLLHGGLPGGGQAPPPGAGAGAGAGASSDGSSSSKSCSSAPAPPPVLSLSWQLPQLSCELHDSPAGRQSSSSSSTTTTLLALELVGATITARGSGPNLTAQLALQDARLLDCCSDPGVQECVLQRVDTGGPIAALAAALPGSGTGKERVRALPQPLLVAGVEAQQGAAHVSVQLQPLQMLARPGCIAAMTCLTSGLPQDTLAAHAARAAADMPAAAAAQTPVAASPALQSKMLRSSFSVHVPEVLLLLPSEMHYAHSSSVLLRVLGLHVGPPPAGDEGARGVVVLAPDVGSADAHLPSAAAVEPSPTRQQQQQQQHCRYVLEIETVSLSLHQASVSDSGGSSSAAAAAAAAALAAPPALEMLQLPPLQGTIVYSSTHGSTPRRTSARRAAPPPVRVALQLPPVSVLITASGLARLNEVCTALAFQASLPLDDLVACYHLSPQQQCAAVAAARTARQSAAGGAVHTGTNQGSNTSPTSSDAVVQTPGLLPTTEAAMSTAHAEAAAVRSASADTEIQAHQQLQQQQQQQQQQQARQHAMQTPLRRCDSDRLLQSMSFSPTDADRQGTLLHSCQESVVKEELRPGSGSKARQSQTGVAAEPAAPPAQLLAVELLLEELDMQYIDDAAETGNNLHLRLQASLLHINAHASTHGSSVELALCDVVLQDMLALPTVAGSTPTPAAYQQQQQQLPPPWRLLSNVCIDRAALSWRRALHPTAELQQVQASLEGLHIQVRVFYGCSRDCHCHHQHNTYAAHCCHCCCCCNRYDCCRGSQVTVAHS
jgi:hypothetical protein